MEIIDRIITKETIIITKIDNKENNRITIKEIIIEITRIKKVEKIVTLIEIIDREIIIIRITKIGVILTGIINSIKIKVIIIGIITNKEIDSIRIIEMITNKEIDNFKIIEKITNKEAGIIKIKINTGNRITIKNQIRHKKHGNLMKVNKSHGKIIIKINNCLIIGKVKIIKNKTKLKINPFDKTLKTVGK